MSMPRFHLAFPVDDLNAARRFYGETLGCTEGRSAERWVDFDFRGHQISAHLTDESEASATNAVDGESVPVRHFGLILEWDEWHALAEDLRGKGVDFLIEPQHRFRDKPGEQATLFIRDPAGNALEFKAFRSDTDIFDRG